MYNEKDLKTILTRAIEIQKSTAGSDLYSGSHEKLSLEEIEEIARESGLEPEYVRQAALELEGIPIEKPFSLDTGNNYEVEIIGFAKGKFDQKTWAELRSIIESEFKSIGTVKRHPEGIIWKAKPTGIFKFLKTENSPSVEVTNSGYRTIIRIKKSLKTYKKLLYPAYAALAGSVMILTIFFQTGEPEILFFIAGLLGISKLFFTWCDSLKKKSKEKLKDTMIQLQTIVIRRFHVSEQDNNFKNQISIDMKEREDKISESGQEPDNQVRKRTH